METVLNDENDMDTQEREESDQEPTDGEDSVVTPSRSRASSAHPTNDSIDVFGGYSFKQWYSVTCGDGGATGEEGEDQDKLEDQDDVRTERDEEDKDWESIETDAEKRGRARGSSVFAPGVVDLYRFSDVQKGASPKSVGAGARGNPMAPPAAANNKFNSPGPVVEERRLRNGVPHIPHIPETSSRTKSPPYTSRRPFPSPDASSKGSTMRSLHTARTTPGRCSRS